LLYKEGKGTGKDIALTVECFYQAMYLDSDDRKVRQQNDLVHKPVYPYAACNLASLYLKGDENFPKDEKKALFWFTVSAAAGHEGAKKVIERMGIPEPDKLYQEINKISFWKAQLEPLAEKTEPKEILNEFTKSLGLEADWKITKNDQAWCYIDPRELSTLEENSLKPFSLRKTVNQQFILLLEKMSNYDLLEIFNRIKGQLKITNTLSKMDL
jgi:hypothetical protein